MSALVTTLRERAEVVKGQHPEGNGHCWKDGCLIYWRKVGTLDKFERLRKDPDVYLEFMKGSPVYFQWMKGSTHIVVWFADSELHAMTLWNSVREYQGVDIR